LKDPNVDRQNVEITKRLKDPTPTPTPRHANVKMDAKMDADAKNFCSVQIFVQRNWHY
jgi:hypothetical protein